MTDRLITRRGMNRRDLIGSGALASLFAATGLPAAAAPRQGGALRIAAPGPDMFERLIAPGAVFDCLTELDPVGALKGELAATWMARAGGREWIVTLRDDAAFHGGTPVTSADVVASLAPYTGRGPLAGVDRLRALGPRGVVLQTSDPDPDLPLRLAHPDLVIRPADPALAGTGSGLYRIVEEHRGTRVRLARADAQDRGRRAGWFDRVEILRLDDPGDRLAVLRSGRVDLALDLPRSAGPTLSRERRLTLSSVRGESGTGPVTIRAGHVIRLHGIQGQNVLRIAERGFFA